MSRIREEGRESVNIAYFLTPKADVRTLFDDNTFRKGLEVMGDGKYTVIPVTTRDNLYVGAVSTSDFLWYLYTGDVDEKGNVSTRSIDGVTVGDIMEKNTHPAVNITATLEQLIERIMNQNFVPVVDARNAFIGIVTRHNVLEYLKNNNMQA